MANSKVVLDTQKLDQLIQQEPAKVETWLDGFALDLLSRIVLSLNSPSPSSPGEPPGKDIGTLQLSMHLDPNHKPMERIISDGVLYGLPLEDGTESIAPRPFIAPAFADAQKRIGPDAQQNLGLDKL